MEPRIQYAKTTDGVSIAFASMGEGFPLIRVPQPGMTHVQRDWTFLPSFYQGLAQTLRHIWYDSRGTGLSERNVVDFSMAAMIADLEAVIDSTEASTFGLVALNDGVPIAVTYSARFPSRVSHLILVDGWVASDDSMEMPSVEAHDALIEKDWRLFTETLAQVFTNLDDAEVSRAFGEHIRASIEPEAYRAFNAAFKRYDVSDMLGEVRAQTLVLHNNTHGFHPARAGQRLAAGIRGARFMAIDDTAYRQVASLVEEFLGVTPDVAPATAASGPGPSSGMIAILFADIVDSTALTERLGDAAFRDKARDLDAALRTIIRDSGGTPVEGKLLGDGVLAVFTSARKAIEAALSCGAAGDDRGLPLHLGLHAGDVIEEDGNVFGGAVNIAARVAGESAPGEVLVSDIVRGLARTSAGVSFEDAGERSLKGVGEPVHVWRVTGVR